MRPLALTVILIWAAFSCDSNKTQQNLDDNSKDKRLQFTYLFENNRDTVLMGDTVDFAMTLSNIEFDSISVILGQLDSVVLLDTFAILEVKNNSFFFKLIPNGPGPNKVEGLVKEYDRQEDQTIVKSTPFSIDFFVIEPTQHQNRLKKG